MIGGEYKGGKYDKRNQKWVEIGNMTYHTEDEFKGIFSLAGYIDVRVFEDYDRGWICGLGKKSK
jgi:hypothetical protein